MPLSQVEGVLGGPAGYRTVKKDVVEDPIHFRQSATRGGISTTARKMMVSINGDWQMLPWSSS